MQRKARLMIWAGMGLLMGAVGRLTIGEPTVTADGDLGVSRAVTGGQTEKSSVANTAATAGRPSLEAIRQARGLEKRLLVANYLTGASLDEVVGLLEDLYTENGRDLHASVGLILLRGFELDAHGLVSAVRDLPKRHYHLQNIYREWVKIDPEAALAASEDEGKGVRQTALVALADDDPGRALALLEAEDLGRDYQRRHIKAMQLTKLLDTDVEGALDHAMALPNARTRKQALSRVMEAWAKKDVLAAMRWLDEQETLPDRVELLAKVLPALAEKSPVRAWEVLDSLPIGPGRGRLEGEIVARRAVKDFEGALQAVRAAPVGPYRDHLFNKLLEAKKPENLLDLVRELEIERNDQFSLTGLDINTKGHGWGYGGGSNHVRSAMKEAFLTLAQTSPAEAFAAAHETMGDGWRFREMAQSIGSQWVGEDPAAAAKWALSVPESSLAKTLQNTVFGEWARASPQAAAEFIANAGLLASESHSRTVKELTKTWAERAPDDLLGWAAVLPESSREPVLSQALRDVAQHVPETAASHLELLGSTSAQEPVMQAIGSSWSKRDPQAAMAWLEEQPAEFELDGTMKDAAKAWVLASPVSASEWIADLGEGSRRDHAVAGMVHALISSRNPEKDFEAANQWVATIADPDLQEHWTKEIATRQAGGADASPPSEVWESSISISAGGVISIEP